MVLCPLLLVCRKRLCVEGLMIYMRRWLDDVLDGGCAKRVDEGNEMGFS